MDGAPPTARVRVKSRTGDVYVRAGRSWRADAWVSVEVPLDVAVRLHDDPWLDVRDLTADAPVSNDSAGIAENGTLERQLADAHARIAALEERVRDVERQHGLELEQLREAHARELSAAIAATSSRTTRRTERHE